MRRLHRYTCQAMRARTSAAAAAEAAAIVVVGTGFEEEAATTVVGVASEVVGSERVE